MHGKALAMHRFFMLYEGCAQPNNYYGKVGFVTKSVSQMLNLDILPLRQAALKDIKKKNVLTAYIYKFITFVDKRGK